VNPPAVDSCVTLWALRRSCPFAAPIVITSGLSTILGGILNARGVFAVPALTPALSSAIPLMALALPSARRSIELIACATLAGYGLELVVLAVVVWRALGRATPVRDGNGDGAAGRVLKGYLPMVGGMIVSAASPLVDQFMSTQLGDGAVATLSFGGKVPAFVMGLGATAVGTAVLPYFSRLVAAKDFVGIRRSLRNWSVAIFVIYLPIMALGFVFARPLIRTLFERGAFHANDTETTARVFLAYLPQLPFYVLGVLGCRLLSALNKNRVIMLIAFLNVLINFVGDYTFMHWLGLPGIALSTSMVYFLSTSLVFAALRNVGEGAGRQRPNAMRTAAGN
jgi:putative peptidoglycan lipid II flippase